MVFLMFCFQLHQPIRLRKYTVFDIGKKHDYFDDDKNKEVIIDICEKSYLKANKMVLKLLEDNKDFKVSFSISGVLLEQFEKFYPEVIKSFKGLVDTGRVEILGETYYHSLSFLYSKDEFIDQVKKHSEKVEGLFGVRPIIFKNTGIVYNKECIDTLVELGFKGGIFQSNRDFLNFNPQNEIYNIKGSEGFKVLFNNPELSEDIMVRFSNENWSEYPLSSKKYVNWINSINGDNCNILLNYEAIGEINTQESGIFEFFNDIPSIFLDKEENKFVLPKDLIGYESKDLDISDELFINYVRSNLNSLIENKMQQSSLKELFLIEKKVKESGYKDLLDDWRNLTTSDHFYYMCTKWMYNETEKYTIYPSPYDAFINFMNVLNDIIIRLKLKEKKDINQSQ